MKIVLGACRGKLRITVTMAPAIIITPVVIMPFTRRPHTSAYGVTGMTLGDPNDSSKSAPPHLYKTNNSVHNAVINIKLRLDDKWSIFNKRFNSH